MFSATSPLLFRPQYDLDQWCVQRSLQRGEQMLYQHGVAELKAEGGRVQRVKARDRANGAVHRLQSDAYVVAYVADTAPLLKGGGLRVSILKPEQAPLVSLMDDQFKNSILRLADKLRVAGTIELGGNDLSLDSPMAKKRCRILLERMTQVFPGVLDTRTREEGGVASILVGFKACNAHQHASAWSNGLEKTVDQRWPRHPGMDAWHRLGQGFDRIDGRRATGNEFQFCKRVGKPVTRRPTFFNILAHRTRAELGHLTVAPFFRHLKNRRQICQNPLFKPTQA